MTVPAGVVSPNFIQALSVPKVCSTVARRMRMASGLRSSLACMASITASCAQRLIRRCLPLVQRAFSGQSAQLVVQ